MKARIATTLSVSVIGVEGHIVEVEGHVGSGLVSFTLVGLPDTSMKEAKDRVRSALLACGKELPDRRVTVNLSPAGLPKSGSACDAAIAIAILIAAGKLPAHKYMDCVILAELGLDASLRPIRGILPAVLAASRHGISRVILAQENAQEASLVPGVEVLPFTHLADIVCWGGGEAEKPLTFHAGATRTLPAPPAPAPVSLDLSDVRGQGAARRALEVAAAGGHHAHFIGEPGAGKTMLAARLPTILPDLDDRTALETTAIHSVASNGLPQGGLIRQPPMCSPHHSITMAAMIGGGAQIPRPGAVSLAHGGVLFLDEAPEFAPSVLDALRQPLEEGHVRLHRAQGATTYPSRFQLILASNPCPCGHYGARTRQCTCSSIELRRYQARLSGPLRDRIDLTVPLRTPTQWDLRSDSGEDSATVRERITAARDRMSFRLRHSPWTLNTELPGRWIRRNTPVPAEIMTRIDDATDAGLLSMRGADRVLRLMWTLADLDGRDTPDTADLGEALSLRTGGSDFHV